MSAGYPYHHPSNTPEKRRARAAHAGSAPKINQRGVRLSERDEDVLETLFFVDWMDIDCIRDLHYEGVGWGTCANRLNKIYADKTGYLKKTVVPVEGTAFTASSQVTYSQITLYALSSKGRARIARRLEKGGLDANTLFAGGRPEADSTEFAGLDAPDPRTADHLLAVSDLYAIVAGRLRSQLGDSGIGTWYWRSERRACFSYSLGGGYYVYRPDAELVVSIPESARSSIDGELSHAHLLIEVQPAPNTGSGDIEGKVGAFARAFPAVAGERISDRRAFAYEPGRDPTPNRWSLYVATETPAQTDAAMRTAGSLGLRHCWAEDMHSIAGRIAEHALDPTRYLALG